MTDKIEKAVKEAIARVPGIQQLSEKAYYESVSEALELILEGVNMRLEELSEDEELASHQKKHG